MIPKGSQRVAGGRSPPGLRWRTSPHPEGMPAPNIVGVRFWHPLRMRRSICRIPGGGALRSNSRLLPVIAPRRDAPPARSYAFVPARSYVVAPIRKCVIAAVRSHFAVISAGSGTSACSKAAAPRLDSPLRIESLSYLQTTKERLQSPLTDFRERGYTSAALERHRVARPFNPSPRDRMRISRLADSLVRVHPPGTPSRGSVAAAELSPRTSPATESCRQVRFRRSG